MQLRFRYLILAALAALTLTAAEQGNPAQVQLEAAKKKEVVDGDLKAAIKQYGDIVARYGNANRAVTATALVRMAECYAKLGNTESRKIYERVVKEYADQKEAVALARVRLVPFSSTPKTGVVIRQVWTGPNVDREGSVSPDGRYLSFVDWETGDLALHDLENGSSRRLTNKGSWSPSVPI